MIWVHADDVLNLELHGVLEIFIQCPLKMFLDLAGFLNNVVFQQRVELQSFYFCEA